MLFRLYGAAKAERSQAGKARVNWCPASPPGLSPENDIYWAAHVGFLEACTGAVGSSFVESENMPVTRLSTSIEHGFPPTDGEVQRDLKRLLGTAWESLAQDTIRHLTDAARNYYSGDPEGQALSAVRAVESLLGETMEYMVGQAARIDGSAFTVRLQDDTDGFSPEDFRTLSIDVWVSLFKLSDLGGPNSVLGQIFVRAPENSTRIQQDDCLRDLKEISRLYQTVSH